MTPRRRHRLLLVLASAIPLLLALGLRVLGADRPVCSYPLEMYRPSLHKCVLKSSYRAAGGERRERATRRQRHRRPPQIERTEPPKVQPDPPLDDVWPAPPTAFEMRFYGVGE